MTPTIAERANHALHLLVKGTERPLVEVDLHAALVSLVLGLAIVTKRGSLTAPTWKNLLGSKAIGPTLQKGLSTAFALHIAEDSLQSAWHALGGSIDAERLGTLYEALCMVRVDQDLSVQASLVRKRAGSHYTPALVANRIATLALSPLMSDASSTAQVLALRVCDPAMGGGAFLLAATRALTDCLEGARIRSSKTAPVDASRVIAETCLRGVDRDPIAVDVARAALWMEFGALVPEGRLVVGDALLDEQLDWQTTFADVFTRAGHGFDAFVGNPPWISFAGRAAQPLEASLKKTLETRYKSFSGYRNLQGVFIERCASLLAAGGRLGLLVPSSMSEQSGYASTRRAHDGYCTCDDDLPDLGNSFEGVFQPCMALVSTRRSHTQDGSDTPWPVERPDLDDLVRGIVLKMSRDPLPSHLFGERGLQSFGQDVEHLRSTPDARHTVALRTGSDIGAFCRKEAGCWADPTWFGNRLRPASGFAEVQLLIRQTARVPIACLSDGLGFRNSLLAGFADDQFSAEALVAWLNSNPIRYLHYVRHRDARQGMPQVKIGHLRKTPAFPTRAKSSLHDLGVAHSRANVPLSPAQQEHLDALVSDVFDLAGPERDRIHEWAKNLR